MSNGRTQTAVPDVTEWSSTRPRSRLPRNGPFVLPGGVVCHDPGEFGKPRGAPAVLEAGARPGEAETRATRRFLVRESVVRTWRGPARKSAGDESGDRARTVSVESLIRCVRRVEYCSLMAGGLDYGETWRGDERRRGRGRGEHTRHRQDDRQQERCQRQ